MDKMYLAVEEAADLLGITKNTLYVWTCKRKVPYYKISKHLRFSREDLIEYIENQKVEAKKK